MDWCDRGMRLFVFGMGYSGWATAAALRANGGEFSITGTSRDGGADGRILHRFDGTAPGATLGPDLIAATHVLVSIPPDAGGDAVLRQHRADLDRATDLAWLGYLSTVGVYGDFAGGRVDETAATRPANTRSRLRVAVEQTWRAYAAERGVPLLILRLAGIYGPGRSAFDKLRNGTARRIVKPGQVFNRIHVADIGRVTALAAGRRLNGTFNLADDSPAPPQDVVAHAADLIGVVPPPEIAFDAAEMTPMARSFYGDNKRVANGAIKRALGIELLYPTYREGLAAILAEEKTQ
jgi:nucleoside-diphosphate-sugar epimerase